MPFEYTRVHFGFDHTNPEHTRHGWNTMDWHRLAVSAGSSMLDDQQDEVRCVTDSLCAKKYIRVGTRFIVDRDQWLPMIQYSHCSKSHSILVRRTSTIWVNVEVRELENGDVRVWAGLESGEAEVYETLNVRDGESVKLKEVANSLHAKLACRQRCTVQSKIHWVSQAKTITVQKTIYKKKRRD